MSWSIEEHIGEGRPWPEQVVVYRGETDESLTYARRSLSDVNQMVELMDALAADNAKLRELAARVERARRDLCDAYPDAEMLNCEECPAWSACKGDLADRMRELRVEVDDG